MRLRPPSFRFLLILWALLTAALPGQLFQQKLQRKPTESETLTLSRALNDARSPEPSVRSGAVMLLGKYPFAQAQAAVVRALNDPSEIVRRAAAVSIIEWEYGVPENAVLPLISRLDDTDVEVRRTVSANLQKILPSYRLSYLQPDAQKQMGAKIQRGFGDQDAFVRKNLLDFAGSSPFFQPEKPILEKLLGDEDADVRIRSFKMAEGAFPPNALIRLIASWKESPLAPERKAYVELLIKSPSANDVPLLKALLADSDNAIATTALHGLFRIDPSSAEAFAVLIERLEAHTVADVQGASLLRTLQTADDDLPSAAVERIFELSYGNIRPEAARLYLASKSLSETGKTKRLRTVLSDSRADIRQIAFSSLYSFPPSALQHWVTELAASPHDDVRRSALDLFHKEGTLESSDAQIKNRFEQLLYEFLIDSRVEIRAKALTLMVNARASGWEDTLEAFVAETDPKLLDTVFELSNHLGYDRRVRLLKSLIETHPHSRAAMKARVFTD